MAASDRLARVYPHVGGLGCLAGRCQKAAGRMLQGFRMKASINKGMGAGGGV
ncbi:hypothetical protein BW21_283 [Burkholderia humptydooensis]|nr:hypothetical protein BW21_283 [Burkholderia sp. 2002721687]